MPSQPAALVTAVCRVMAHEHMQAAADWLVDDEDTAASVEEREAAWRDAETAADRERLEHENELRAVRQQLCCRCAAMPSKARSRPWYPT